MWTVEFFHFGGRAGRKWVTNHMLFCPLPPPSSRPRYPLPPLSPAGDRDANRARITSACHLTFFRHRTRVFRLCDILIVRAVKTRQPQYLNRRDICPKTEPCFEGFDSGLPLVSSTEESFSTVGEAQSIRWDNCSRLHLRRMMGKVKAKWRKEGGGKAGGYLPDSWSPRLRLEAPSPSPSGTRQHILTDTRLPARSKWET